MSSVFAWKLLWRLQLQSLFDFMHEQKLFRHDVLQLHLLYPWPKNSDAFPAYSLTETLIDRTSEILTVLSVHVVNWLRVCNEFSIPSFVPILQKFLMRSTSLITPNIILNIWPLYFPSIANFSLKKYLSGRHRHFECLCFQITFHSFSFSIILFLRLRMMILL